MNLSAEQRTQKKTRALEFIRQIQMLPSGDSKSSRVAAGAGRTKNLKSLRMMNRAEEM